MTRRRSPRELERAVEDLSTDPDGYFVSGWITVYQDPTTGKLYQGRGRDAPPVESIPGDVGLLICPRTMGMRRSEALDDGREIVGTAENAPPGVDVVSVRIAPAPGVDVDVAVTLDPDDPGTHTIDFEGADT